MSDSIFIKKVESKKELKAFIRFPYELYRDNKNFIPPLMSDETSFFDESKNGNLVKNPYVLFLAYRDGKIVGRIMGLINEYANSLRDEKICRWTYLDTVDDEDVVTSLLDYVSRWGKNLGMNELVGPRGFSDQEPQGAIIDGFDKRNPIGTIQNMPYLIPYLEKYGFEKDVDWVNYRINVPEKLPKSMQAMFTRAKKSLPYTCRSFASKSELKPHIKPIMKLLNETYKDLYGFAPMTDAEMEALVKKYLPVLDPEFVNIVENKDGELLGFAVVMPDVTEGLKRANGKLFPFGFIHLLRSFKHSKTLQLLLVGIKSEYRGQGLFTLFAENMLKSVHKRKMKMIDSHLTLESNQSIRKWMELLGGQIDRRYRAYKMEL